VLFAVTSLWKIRVCQPR